MELEALKAKALVEDGIVRHSRFKTVTYWWNKSGEHLTPVECTLFDNTFCRYTDCIDFGDRKITVPMEDNQHFDGELSASNEDYIEDVYRVKKAVQ